jgi:hypothetical protein
MGLIRGYGVYVSRKGGFEMQDGFDEGILGWNVDGGRGLI